MRTEPRSMPAPGMVQAASPSDFRLEEFLPYQLSVAANRVSRLFAQRYCGAFGLTIPEWRVLATIARFGTISPGTVGEWTAMDKVKVSRAAAALVGRGLVRQSLDPQDGRGRLLRLTRKGEAAHQGMLPQAQALEALLAERLGHAQWVTLRKALMRLNAHAQSIEGTDDGEAED